MSLAVFPANIRGLTYPSAKTPSFNSIEQDSPAFVDNVISQAQNPRWKWSLIYEYLKDDDIQAGQTYTDLQLLRGFLLSLRGIGAQFLYSDPYDNSVGPALNPLTSAPNLQAQLQIVNDGASSPTYYSPIQRNVGGQFYEDITDLNGSIAVYDNGTLTTNYTIVGPGLAIPGYSYQGLVLKWVSAPTGPVTATFNFYFRCRIASDETEMTQFMQYLWTLGGSRSSSGSTLDIRTSAPVQA